MIITNSGGPVNLPDLSLSPGDNVVQPQTWNRVKEDSVCKALLASGRLCTHEPKRDSGVADEPAPDAADPAYAAPPVTEPNEDSGDPAPELQATDYSGMTAKEMIAEISTMTEADLDGLADETRKTVISAIESRYDELAEES